MTMAQNTDLDDLIKKVKATEEDDSEDEAFGGQEKKKRRKPFVDWPRFNMLIGVMIAVNAVTIGLETDVQTEKIRNPDYYDENANLWVLAELFFVVVFTAELIARLYFYRCSFFTGTNRTWNTADFCIVTVSVLDAIVLTPMSIGGGEVRFLQMLRFARLTRLIRLVRLFKIFKELWLVASGLISSLRTVFWVCITLWLLVYIWAVYATYTIGQNDADYDPYWRETQWDHEKYFGTVGRSLFTFVQILTLENWCDEIVRHVLAVQPELLLFFLAFIFISVFGLLNLIVGVVVENTIHTAAADEEAVMGKKENERAGVINNLRQIFEEADADGSGSLTIEEVREAIHKPDIYLKLRMIDFPVDDPEQIFDVLDYDFSGELTIDEFISGCIRMKGDAKAKDLLVVQVAMDTLNKHCHLFEEEMQLLKDRTNELTECAKGIIDHGELYFLNSQEYRLRHPDFSGTEMPAERAKIEDAPWVRSPSTATRRTGLGAKILGGLEEGMYESEPASPPAAIRAGSSDHLARDGVAELLALEMFNDNAVCDLDDPGKTYRQALEDAEVLSIADKHEEVAAILDNQQDFFDMVQQHQDSLALVPVEAVRPGHRR
eukprot:TRINITY_DN111537_c0_g1_i1.p1 TRINITY_DN111537_c0_g1~~TRINITY_DN111537_c0_g1_i1.p1  ORF type:complete len:604 (-),score=164.91 TRINITY_DN111537_c0_g1_i1:156-1967(-)